MVTKVLIVHVSNKGMSTFLLHCLFSCLFSAGTYIKLQRRGNSNYSFVDYINMWQNVDFDESAADIDEQKLRYSVKLAIGLMLNSGSSDTLKKVISTNNNCDS